MAAPGSVVLAPLPAGVWDVRVVPGRDWDFDLTQVGAHGVGTVLDPSTAVVEWCAGVAGRARVGGPCVDCPVHDLGGWFLSRSAVVQWDGDENFYYYKAGDNGLYDLAWAVPSGPALMCSIHRYLSSRAVSRGRDTPCATYRLRLHFRLGPVRRGRERLPRPSAAIRSSPRSGHH